MTSLADELRTAVLAFAIALAGASLFAIGVKVGLQHATNEARAELNMVHRDLEVCDDRLAMNLTYLTLIADRLKAIDKQLREF